MSNSDSIPRNKPIHPKKKKSKLSYHRNGESRPAICKTSVTKYGALGKNIRQKIKNITKRPAGISFLMKNSETTYGIHAKKRFQIKYKRSSFPHKIKANQFKKNNRD